MSDKIFAALDEVNGQASKRRDFIGPISQNPAR
jgi:hypothetical protein